MIASQYSSFLTLAFRIPPSVVTEIKARSLMCCKIAFPSLILHFTSEQLTDPRHCESR